MASRRRKGTTERSYTSPANRPMFPKGKYEGMAPQSRSNGKSKLPKKPYGQVDARNA